MCFGELSLIIKKGRVFSSVLCLEVRALTDCILMNSKFLHKCILNVSFIVQSVRACVWQQSTQLRL